MTDLPSAPTPTGVPRTREELEQVVATCPDGWEFLLFAGVLLQGKNDLDRRWRDHQLRLPTADYHRIGDDEVAGYLSAAFGRLAWTISPIERIFDAQEDAFGKPGEPGNAVLIEHFADWIITVYRRLLDWAGAVRSVGVPEEFELAVELAAQAADLPLERIRSFIDDTVTTTDRLPGQLAVPAGERDPIEIRLILTLDVDNDLMGSAVDELARALGQVSGD